MLRTVTSCSVAMVTLFCGEEAGSRRLAGCGGVVGRWWQGKAAGSLSSKLSIDVERWEGRGGPFNRCHSRWLWLLSLCSMFSSNLRISSVTEIVEVAVSFQLVLSLDDWSSPLVCSSDDRVPLVLSLEDLASLVLSLEDRAPLAPPLSLDDPTPLSPVLSFSQPPLLPSDSPDSAHIRGLGVGEGALASESLPDGKMM